MINDKSDPVRRLLRLPVIGFFALTLTVIGAAILWRSLLARDVNARLREVKSAGLPTSGEELNQWYAAVPENQNAALVVTQALALLARYPDARSNDVARFKVPPRNQKLTDDNAALLAGYVELNAPALAKLQDALDLPKSRYPVDCALGVYTPLPHLSKIKMLAQIAQYKSLVAAQSGNPVESCRDIQLILGLTHSLEPEPILISQLVRIATLALAVNTLERVLNQTDLNQKDIADLAAAFATSEKTNLIAHALIGERAMYIPYFRMSAAEAKRITRADEDGETHPNEPPLPGKQAIWVRVTGFLQRDLNFFLRAMETNITTASFEPPKSLAAEQGFEGASESASRSYYLLSSMLLPGFGRTVRREAESLAHVRLALTALAIERFRATHGKLPENLNVLAPGSAVPKDPFDGTPLRYRPLTNGYVVYSVGADRHDDSGREPPERKKSSDTNSYDITFTVER